MTTFKPTLTGLALAATSLFVAPAATQPDALTTVKFALPLACEIGRTCEVQNYVDRDPSPAVTDYRCGTASYNEHSGVDFRLLDMAAQRRGVNVLAAASGRVLRARDGVADVSVKTIDRATIEGRECGNGVVIDHGGGITTQYCHMRNGSIVARPGTQINAGDPVGQVGLSGNTEYPHLHFTVKRGNDIIDPFAPLPGSRGQCGTGAGMWQSRAASALTYRAGLVLNAGFSSSVITMAQVEDGTIAAPRRDAPMIIAYVRAINLQQGDVQTMTLKAPDGTVIANQISDPLPRAQAQRLLFTGKRRPQTGWPSGRYVADYSVQRGQQVVVTRQFELRL